MRHAAAVGLAVLVATAACGLALLRDGPPVAARSQPPAWTTPDHRAAFATWDGVPATSPAPVRSTRTDLAGQGGAAVFAVAAPRRLMVGDVEELFVDVEARDGLGEISFTVQFDPDLLQVRAGFEGEGSAIPGQPRRFVAEIAPAEDRIQIRSFVGAGLAGRVAIVQFQAVAPGSTSVIVSDASAVDRAGRPIAARVIGATPSITIESPPRQAPSTPVSTRLGIPLSSDVPDSD